MTEKETRQWAFEQATRLFRNGETVAVLKFAKEIYDFVEGRSDAVEKTPTKENCPNTYKNVVSIGKQEVTEGLFKHFQEDTFPQAKLSKEATDNLSNMGRLDDKNSLIFKTYDEIINFLTKNEKQQ